MKPLVPNPDDIRIAMLGMVDGNGYPYSWSAIIGGRYDAAVMADCGFPVIPQYLGAEPPENLGIPGVKVTHVWCDDRADAEKVAKAAFIPNVVDHPEDVLGEVDAVVIATDRGWEHVDRARLFIETGVPLFIDKPLCDREEDLRWFIDWHDSGKPFLSTSAMRYAKEFAAAREQMAENGRSTQAVDHHLAEELGAIRHSRPGSGLSDITAGRMALGRQHRHTVGQHSSRAARRRSGHRVGSRR